MANNYRDIDIERLNELAWEYILFCIGATTETATNKGVVEVKERHLPTIRYFLYIWLRQHHFEFYTKSNWYDALKDKEHPLSDTIKNINETFDALAVDIVANEGKGIFYAKNKLGMSDKVEAKTDNNHVLSGKVNVTVISSGIPLANRETDVNI